MFCNVTALVGWHAAWVPRRGSGVGTPNKRVGPGLLESGAGKARKRGVSGGRGGGTGVPRGGRFL